MRRRRLLAAIAIITCTLGALAWVDNLVLLRNSAELDTRARLLLTKLFPDWKPRIEHIEVDFPNRFVVSNLVLEEKGSGRALATIDRVEATLSLSDWLQPRSVSIRGVRLSLRRFKDGKLNLELPASRGGEGGSAPVSLSSPVDLHLEDARLLFEDEDTSSRTLVTCHDASVTVYPDGRVAGGGLVTAGAVVAPSSPFASGGEKGRVEGEPLALYREILPHIHFEVDRRADGRLAIPLDVERAQVGPVLRSILPRYVQEVIWSELNPTGLANARVTLRLGGTEKGVRPEVNVQAKGCTLRPKGFPYLVKDISGRFEIAPGIVSWEEVTASLNGAGRLRSRGTFFLGEAQERVTLFIFIEAKDIPFDEDLRAAMPADVRSVYEQFQVQGVCGPSKVMIFKGPFQEDPQLSIRSEVDGRQSAAFADYPVRFAAEKGSFTLMEGGNVEVDTTGALELGGRAHVHARVVHGDLMHVEVEGDAPVGAALTARLDPGVRRMVEPFHAEGGRAEFKLVVEKSDPRARPVPRVDVTLVGVPVAPDIFPYRLRTDGRLRITPSWPEDAPLNAPPAVKVDLSLDASAPAITAAVISGSVFLDPKKGGDWSGDLTVRASRLEADPELRRALPREIAQVVDRLAPRGGLKDVRAHVLSINSFEATGEGDVLSTALDAFPYRSQVDRFSIARDGRTFSLRSVEGRTVGGGHFALKGEIELPPTSSGRGDPLVSVAVNAKGVPLEGSLLAALPEAARGALEKLSPDAGRLDASLRIGIAPAVPLDLQGEVRLDRVRVRLDKLDPSLEGMSAAPVEDMSGLLRLDGERVHLEGVHGRFRGASVAVGGSIAMGARSSGDAGIAPPASADAIDVVAHVDGLVLDAASRALARGATAKALERFPVEGPCDLDLRVRRSGSDTALAVRIHPRGVHVVPVILPFPFEDVRGTIEVNGGDPTFVELTARLGKAEVEIRRDARLESFAQQGSSVYLVRARDLDPRELADRGPEDFARAVHDLDLEGTFDVSLDVAVPADDRAKNRFLAELRTTSLDVTSGLRFEGVKGALLVSGSIAKFEPLELDGALAVDSASWRKQTIQNAYIPVKLRKGELLLGTPREPFKATFYGGLLRGRVETDLKPGGTGYKGYLYLEKANLQEAADELSHLKEEKQNEPKSGGIGTAVHGDLMGSLTFRGGSPGQDGKPLGISGEGVLQATHANLIRVPLLFGTVVDVFSGAVRGDSSFDPKSFDGLFARLFLKPSHIEIDQLRLDSDTLTLGGNNGRLEWSGGIDIDLLPVRGGVFDEIFKQFVGVSVRGTVGEPDVKTIPFSNISYRVWHGVKKMIFPEDEETKKDGR